MKRMRFILGLGLLIGLVLTGVRILFDIDKDTFMSYYWVVGTILVIAAAGIYALRTSKSTKEMNKAIRLLNEGRAEEYIAIVEKLERNAKTTAMRNLLRLNLTAGYCDLQEYDQAIAILEHLGREKLNKEMELVRRLNLCACYFYNEQTEEAMALYEENRDLFEETKQKGKHQINLILLDMFTKLELGEYDEVRTILKETKKQWEGPRLEKDFRKIEARLKEYKA